MTVEASETADRQSITTPPLSTTGPLALWLGLQLLVILIAAAQVPLAAQYPQPPERLAAHLLLATEVVIASLLFPLLLRDAGSAAQTLATALPFQLAAAALAGQAFGETLPAIAVVDGWILTLALWAIVLRDAATQMIGVAVASGLTIGGGLLAYLRAEFSVPPAGWTPESASPLLTTLIALGRGDTLPGWILVGGTASGAVLALLMRRVFARRALERNQQMISPVPREASH